jgi:hypothetical protein
MGASTNTLKFRDLETGHEALAVSRRVGDAIVIGLSHQYDGDIEVVMTAEQAREFVVGIQKAIDTAE